MARKENQKRQTSQKRVLRNTARGPHPVDIHVGKRVRMRRSLLGLSQEHLAKAVNVTFQQIQKYERGTNRVSAGRLYQFSKILDVPISYFYQEYGESDKAKKAIYALADNDQDDFLSEEVLYSREALDLLKTYYSLEDEKKRKELLKIIRSMVDNMAD